MDRLKNINLKNGESFCFVFSEDNDNNSYPIIEIPNNFSNDNIEELTVATILKNMSNISSSSSRKSNTKHIFDDYEGNSANKKIKLIPNNGVTSEMLENVHLKNINKDNSLMKLPLNNHNITPEDLKNVTLKKNIIIQPKKKLYSRFGLTPEILEEKKFWLIPEKYQKNYSTNYEISNNISPEESYNESNIDDYSEESSGSYNNSNDINALFKELEKMLKNQK